MGGLGLILLIPGLAFGSVPSVPPVPPAPLPGGGGTVWGVGFGRREAERRPEIDAGQLLADDELWLIRQLEEE